GTKAYDQLAEATTLFIGAQSALLDDCCGTHVPGERIEADANVLAEVKSEDGVQPYARPGAKLAFETCYDVAEVNRRFSPGSITLEQLRALEGRLFASPDAPSGPCCKEGGASGVKDLGRAAPSSSDPRLDNVLTFMQQLVENQPGVPLKDCTLGSG